MGGGVDVGDGDGVSVGDGDIVPDDDDEEEDEVVVVDDGATVVDGETLGLGVMTVLTVLIST